MAPRAAGSGSRNWSRRTTIPLHAIRLLLIGLPLPLATSMHTGLPGAPRGKDYGNSTRRLILAATIHAHAALVRSSSAATGRQTSRCIRLGQPKIRPNSDAAVGLQRPPYLAAPAFASRIDRPSSPVRSKLSLATFAQSSFSAGVAALWVCLSASFAVHGI